MLYKFWTPWELYFDARSSEEAVCLDRHWAAPNPEDILLSWGVLVETACYRDTENELGNMDEPVAHYAKWNKPDIESQVLYDLIYMWKLKKSNSQRKVFLLPPFCRGENLSIASYRCTNHSWYLNPGCLTPDTMLLTTKIYIPFPCWLFLWEFYEVNQVSKVCIAHIVE